MYLCYSFIVTYSGVVPSDEEYLECTAKVSVRSGRSRRDGLPGEIKAAAMQLTQASQHGLGIIAYPAPTGAFHPMMDDSIDPAFDGTTANRITYLSEKSLIHFRLAGVEIFGGLTDFIKNIFLFQVQLLESLDNSVGITFSEMV